MKLTVHISTPIRSVVKELPATMVMERTEPLTIRQLAIDIGIPPCWSFSPR